MEKYKKNNSQRASITVFLSLVLLLVLSLLMTVIEGARQTTAMVFAERALTTSMDSVLAGFYGPLMEEYHLLGLDSSFASDSCDYGEIAGRMQDYMSYTLNPSQGIYGADRRLNLYSSFLESVEVTNGTKLVDYKGEVFIHEVTEYMKYRTVGDAVEFFLDAASLLEKPKKVSILYEEKVELEEKLVTIDEGMLALMKYIDGVSTGKKGLIRGKNGGLRTEQSFTKKILYGYPTMDSAGINNETVFLALENQYRDPSESFDVIISCFERLDEALSAIGTLEGSLSTLYVELQDENIALKQLKEILPSIKKEDKDYKESVKADIEEAKKRISQLKDQAKAIKEELEDYSIEKAECIDAITVNGNDISNMASDSLILSRQAIIELEQIIITSKEAEPLIKSYEESFNSQKEGLGSEILESLEEGLEELKRYQIDNSNGYDFPRMKEILTEDCDVLTSCIESLYKGNEAITSGDYANARNAYERACLELSAYDTNGLNINYSTLVIEEEESPDFLGGMKDLIAEGITSLVIDPKTISDKEISSELLPSVIDLLSEEGGGFSFSNLFKNMNIGGKDAGTGGLFGGFGDYSLGALVGYGADEILERILIQGYIKEHFNIFPVNEEEKEGRKPSVLTYEQEYLIYGRTTDKDNLKDVIGRLILIRTILNFVTILGSKEKWKEAKSIATSLVGFTGLPILVAITQGLLMILLAIAAALVDTCALLTGKDIPIIKKNVDLKYSDLLMLTRGYIQKKAELYKDEKGLSYKDYLTLFLCLTSQRKLSYRMMDLIQENIKIRYGKDFNLQNCMFGYEIEAKFNIKPLFTTFSFMHKYIGTDTNKGLMYRAECSY